MNIENFTRQEEIFNPYNFNVPVHIIGAGATGSWVTMILAKMGIKNINLYDFDTVGEHNLPNQCFDIESIEKNKALELTRIIKQFTNVNINAKNIKVDKSFRFNGIVFMLTDTMKSRKEIWENCIKFNVNIPIYIETRMDLRGGRIYTINPLDLTQIKEYEKTLYTDEEAAVSACGTSQSIITTAMQISTIAVWQMLNCINNNEILYNEILVDSEFHQFFNNKYEKY